MSDALVYRTWETGAQGSPPPILDQAVQPPERLLWAAEVPIERLHKRWVWLVVVAIPATFLFAQVAPWGQTMAEYCAGDEGPSCRKLYVFAWPGVISFAYASLFGMYMFWKSKASPWLNYFGITTVHALVIHGNNPGKVRRRKLDRTSARVDWFDAVRFDGTKAGLGFVTLDIADARRAVYWANEGRFRTEFQDGLTP